MVGLTEIDEKTVACPPYCKHEMPRLTMGGMFSFNKPEGGACETCGGGLGTVTDIDISKVVDESLS